MYWSPCPCPLFHKLRQFHLQSYSGIREPSAARGNTQGVLYTIHVYTTCPLPKDLYASMAILLPSDRVQHRLCAAPIFLHEVVGPLTIQVPWPALHLPLQIPTYLMQFLTPPYPSIFQTELRAKRYPQAIGIQPSSTANPAASTIP